jgi:hypothetical protein
VPVNGQDPPVTRPPILAKEEASRRAALLCDLQSALAARGISSILARNHRLVLEGASTKCAPSGPTDPQLHIFTPGGTSITTTNGKAYLLDGDRYPAGDPDGAAAAACRHAAPSTPGRGPAGGVA